MEYDSANPFSARRRVAVACDHCRRRKMRCDGARPVCTYCSSHNIACVYQRASQKVQVSKQYLDSLTKQIESLRHANARLIDQSSGDLEYDRSRLHENVTSSAHLLSPPSLVPEDVSPLFPTSPARTTTADRNGSLGHEEVVSNESQSLDDTIVCSQAPLSAGENYFGGSSTLAFLEVLQSMALRNGVDIPQRPRLSGHHVRNEIQESTGIRSQALASNFKSKFLPPRYTADHLVETYFLYVSDMYTVLHEPTFRDEYENVWRSGSQPDDIWFCTLNAVFALGCLFSDRSDLETSESNTRTFFTQAKDLVDFESIDRGNLGMVQALLLMGQYLHIRRVSRCWHVFGVAIRVAQGLGLQMSELNNKYGPVEREIRKRCWCGCMIMDTMLGMTFGRPMMIPSYYYDNPQIPIPVDDVRHMPSQQEDCEAPKILLFISRFKLCVILHDILQALYQGNSNEIVDVFPAEPMLKFDRRLSAWKDNLPAPMRMPDSSQVHFSRASITRPRWMLYTRYLHIRILLTRPSLTIVASIESLRSGEKLKTLDFEYALTTAGVCVDTSKQLIDHISTNPFIEHVAWNSIHSIFSASLVLFAAQLVPALKPLMLDNKPWERAIEVMRDLSQKCSPAQTCLSMLEAFNKCLSESRGARDLQQLAFDEPILGPSELMSPSFLWHNWMDGFGIDETLSRDFNFI